VPNLIVQLAEREAGEILASVPPSGVGAGGGGGGGAMGRRLRGDERVGLEGVLGWESSNEKSWVKAGGDKEKDVKEREKEGKWKGMIGPSAFVRHQGLVVLRSVWVSDPSTEGEKEGQAQTGDGEKTGTEMGKEKERDLKTLVATTLLTPVPAMVGSKEVLKSSSTPNLATTSKRPSTPKKSGDLAAVADNSDAKSRSNPTIPPSSPRPRGDAFAPLSKHSQCGRTAWSCYKYFSPNPLEDVRLGSYVLDFCESAKKGEGCEHEGCEGMKRDHWEEWVHGGLKVMASVSVSEKMKGGGSGGGDERILVSQSCMVCGMRTPEKELDGGASYVSFFMASIQY
jgi:hypothetical protein